MIDGKNSNYAWKCRGGYLQRFPWRCAKVVGREVRGMVIRTRYFLLYGGRQKVVGHRLLLYETSAILFERLPRDLN